MWTAGKQVVSLREKQVRTRVVVVLCGKHEGKFEEESAREQERRRGGRRQGQHENKREGGVYVVRNMMGAFAVEL
jgi:hypothetical protein